TQYDLDARVLAFDCAGAVPGGCPYAIAVVVQPTLPVQPPTTPQAAPSPPPEPALRRRRKRLQFRPPCRRTWSSPCSDQYRCRLACARAEARKASDSGTSLICATTYMEARRWSGVMGSRARRMSSREACGPI